METTIQYPRLRESPVRGSPEYISVNSFLYLNWIPGIDLPLPAPPTNGRRNTSAIVSPFLDLLRSALLCSSS